MSFADPSTHRPSYDRGTRAMITQRGSRASDFARQILDTAAPFMRRRRAELHVLDVGCGYGHTCLVGQRHFGMRFST